MAVQRAGGVLLLAWAALFNEAVEARRQSVLLLRGLGKEGSALQEPPEGVPPAGTVKAEFVSKCALILTANRTELVPIDALDQFCRQTDAYVECKIELVMTYETLHKQGGDLAGFCGDAYEWFRKKYGMLCPLQCEKLQCQSTCAWLKEQKRLKAHAKELDAHGLEVAALQGELDKAIIAVEDAEEDQLKKSRTVSSTRVQEKDAKKELEYRQGRTAEAEDEVTNKEKEVTSLSESLSNYGAQVHAEEAKLAELQRKIDLAQLELDHLQKRRDKLTSEINEGEAGERLNNMTKELQQADMEAESSEAKLAPLKQNLSEVEKNLSSIKQDYQQVNNTLAHASAVLKDATASLMDDKKRQQEAQGLYDGAKANLTKAKKALNNAKKAVTATKMEEAGLRDRVSNETDTLQERQEAHNKESEQHQSWMPKTVAQHGLMDLLQSLLGL